MVIVVNGAPRVGKDSFCQFVQEIMEERVGAQSCLITSTIDLVKDIAKDCGWDGKKTQKNRKFLSDLKDLLTNWGDVPYNDVSTYIDSAKLFWKQYHYSEDKTIVFVMCREPKEIQKFVDRIGAKTLIVRRSEVEDAHQSNHADAEVFNFEYDIHIENHGTVEDLKERARDFVKDFLKGENYERAYW